MGIRKKTDWTEEKIQKKLRWHFMTPSSKMYEMFNTFVYDWESDYFMVTNSGYVYECEIKISRVDFFNDKKKEKKHLILEGKMEDYERPNYLYYAVPKDLITIDEVPENYGLIFITEYSCEVVKKAPALHKEKVNVEKLNLINKFYYSMWNWRDKYESSDIVSLINEKRAFMKEKRAFLKDAMMYENLIGEKDYQIADLEDEIKQLKEKLKENGN